MLTDFYEWLEAVEEDLAMLNYHTELSLADEEWFMDVWDTNYMNSYEAARLFIHEKEFES